jgi:UDP-glucose 4-epimerase
MEKRTALITGGSGYLGSHLSKALKERGWNIILLDLKQPKHTYYDFLVLSDIRTCVDGIFKTYKIDTVFHLAGRIEAGLSFEEPTEFYEVNTGGTLRILNLMKKYDIKKIIYSSTAGVYKAKDERLEEDDEIARNSPYATSKYCSEQAIIDSGLEWVILRYFNLAGADPKGEMGEDHKPETHLIPRILQNLNTVEIYGNDYATPDGTCIRDYVHVSDIADAHILAADYSKNDIFNLGTGFGYSNLEIIKEIENVTGHTVNYTIKPRRSGDADRLAANINKAQSLLGYKPKHDLKSIIKTAYDWHNK